MKFTAFVFLFASSATAFNAFGPKATKNQAPSFSLDTIPGALQPFGLFDPLGFGSKANEATLKRYREAELTHGRVSMLAVIGFLVGEAVEGTSFLFNGSISGPAITHIPQVPSILWPILAASIAKAETIRAEIGWVEPKNVPVGRAGLLRVSAICEGLEPHEV